jgi:adenylate cyclase
MRPRSDVTTRLRLASGLVLMAFVASHLVNHALGIVSLAAMEQGRAVFVAVWRSLPGTVLLYAALLGHIGLVAHKLWRRRTLRMPAWEAAQITLGLLIPFWLAAHIIGTRGVNLRFGINDDYVHVLNALWPNGAWRQTVMLSIVWLHGCIGLHFWLRFRPWYERLKPSLLALGVLLPTLALIGFADAGRELKETLEADPHWLAAHLDLARGPDPAALDWRHRTEQAALAGFILILAATFGGRAARALRSRYLGRVRLHYPNGVTVSIMPGMSVLEASRAAGIPHASVCGGRGRCSTCRIRVGKGAEHLPPPAPDEARVLARIGGTSGNVRLACQLRPTEDLALVPLLPATAGPHDVHVQVDPGQGMEREVAVLFADLRAFTRIAEGRLPYDVVFVLNQYFKAMGEAIERTGGRVDKFLGDGIMALFGVDLEPEAACRQALAGAHAMAHALEVINRQLAQDLREPLKMGIGLHVGPVILGEMGFGRASALTAIGDPVNVASRLEELTKEFGVQLVVSARLAERAGVDLAGLELREIEIRGRRRPLRVRLVPDAGLLPVVTIALVEPVTAPLAQLRSLGRRALRPAP